MKYKYDPDTGIVTGKRGKPLTAIDEQGYLICTPEGKREKVHRHVFKMMGIDIPDGIHVDHINHDRADNRWCNLRLVTRQDNQKNASKRKDNTSGVVGVSWDKGTNRWVARVNVDGDRILLGRFSKFSEAVDARKLAEVAYGYHKNHGGSQC